MAYKIKLIKHELNKACHNFHLKHFIQPTFCSWKTITQLKHYKKEQLKSAKLHHEEYLKVLVYSALKFYCDEKRRMRCLMERALEYRKCKSCKDLLIMLSLYAKKEKATKLRNQVLQAVISKVVDSKTKDAIKKRFFKWKEYQELTRGLNDTFSEGSAKIEKVLLRKKLTEIIETIKELRAIQQMISLSDKQYHKNITIKVIRNWNEKTKKKKQLEKAYLTIHNKASNHQKARCIKQFAMVCKRKQEEKKKFEALQLKHKINTRRSNFELWKSKYQEIQDYKALQSSADAQYKEMLLVKSFAAIKEKAKENEYKRSQLHKAYQAYSMHLQKATLMSLSKYNINCKSKEAQRFELTKRIVKIDQSHTILVAFCYWKNYVISKKRLKQGQNVLQKKVWKRVKYRALQKWIAKLEKVAEDKIREEEEKQKMAIKHNQATLLKKAINGWKETSQEGITKFKREKLHSLFTSWKLMSREKKLLKQYLKQANIDEKYAQTPIASMRYEAPKLGNKSSRFYWFHFFFFV